MRNGPGLRRGGVALAAALLLAPAGVGPGNAPGEPPETNEWYQPSNAEWVVRVSEDTDPNLERLLGDSDPHASLVRTPEGTVQPGQVLTFDASGSFARRGALYGGQRIVNWVWDFGDGVQANAPVVRHAYAAPGIYRVSLAVHDDTGWPATRSHTVQVGEAPCGQAPREVWIPTSGGVLMHGWLTLPPGQGGFPAVLEYGPYIPGPVGDCNDMVRAGYAMARVSAPGRGESQGQWDMFGAVTQRGGYDAVEWLAAQPWSSGRVAMWGVSGPACAALLTAGARPPHLVAVVAKTAYADLYRDMVYAGGVPNSDTFVNLWLPIVAGGDVAYFGGPGPNGEALAHLLDHGRVQAELLLHPTYDAFWQERSIVAYPPPAAAVLYYGNHRDLWPRSTVELQRWIAPAGGRVIALPGGHGSGDLSGWEPGNLHGGEARLWLERHLRGVDNGVDRRPEVLTFTTYGGDGAWGFTHGRWEALEAMPSARTEPLRLYLGPAPAGAAPLPGSHGLAPEAPGGSPGDLVPHLLPWAPLQGATSDNTATTVLAASGTQGAWEPQALVYETPVLARDLRVNGPATVSLHAAVLAPDLAFTAHVHDVWPDGSSHYVSKGALLASHRALDEARSLYLDPDGARVLIRPWHPHDAAGVLPPGVHRFDLEVWGIHNVFKAGHRLRLVLAAQDLGWRTPLVTGPAALVFHDPAYPSALHLAVLPEERSREPFPYQG